MKKRFIIIGSVVLVVLAGAAFFYFLILGGPSRNALAMVNGQKITLDQFSQAVEQVQEPARGMIKENPAEFLDMLIMKALLLQEMKKQGYQPGKDEKGEEEAIQDFLKKKFSSPPSVSREETEAFYEAHKDKLGGMSLEQAAPMLEQAIRQGKQEEEYIQFLQEIRERASVQVNQERLKAMTATAAEPTDTEDDLAKALKSGRPVLVDFGSNTCIPCRQLRPVLKEIRKEQEGKLEVLVIDIYKQQRVSTEYRIQVIPTLVFFDSTGKEMFRHQGFKPKAALMEELKKIGVG